MKLRPFVPMLIVFCVLVCAGMGSIPFLARIATILFCCLVSYLQQKFNNILNFIFSTVPFRSLSYLSYISSMIYFLIKFFYSFFPFPSSHVPSYSFGSGPGSFLHFMPSLGERSESVWTTHACIRF